MGTSRGLVVLGNFYFLYQKSKPKIIRYEIETVTSGSIEKKNSSYRKSRTPKRNLIKPQMSGIISGSLQEMAMLLKQVMSLLK